MLGGYVFVLPDSLVEYSVAGLFYVDWMGILCRLDGYFIFFAEMTVWV